MTEHATDLTRNWRPSIRYEDDFAGWLSEQVALLRDGRLSEIDIGHVAVELE